MSGEGYRRFRAHEVLRPRLRDVADAPINGKDALLRQFTLEDCWLRGGYEGSLLAPTDERSFAWRGDFIRDNLPLLPQDRRGRSIDSSSLWSTVATLNGSSQVAIQRRLGLDAAKLERLLQVAEQQDLLFRLPYWAPRGQTTELLPLVYLSDTGLLHRLLGERMPRTMAGRLRGKSYEGFVIAALITAAGDGATARVWARGQDEIDLILEWAGGAKRWAIEITYSQTKRLSSGFYRGCEETGATRAIVVQGKVVGSIGPDDAERMPLINALREVWEN